MSKEAIIGDFLKRIKRPVELIPSEEYKLVTIKMNHKGVVLRHKKIGSDIKSKMFIVKEGDFILSGIDARNGAFGIVPPELDGAIVTNDFWYFEIDETVVHKDFFLELTSTDWFDEICRKGSDGTTERIRLQRHKFFNQSIFLPEIKEQNDFLVKFKKLSTNHHDLITELGNQQLLIKQLRSQILQDAIEGNLTQKWRENNLEVESVSGLIDKIRIEKEKLLQEKKITKGKKQKSNDLGSLIKGIPDTWQFIDLDDITQYITDGTHQTPSYTKKGRVFLSAQNVKPFKFMPKNHKFVSEEDYQGYIKNKFPEKGDLLVGRVGSKGETAVIDIDLEFAIYVSLGLVKTFKNLTSPDYLAIVLNSPYGIKYATGNMSSLGTSAGNFNLGRIRSFPIPFPPLAEQLEIVSKVTDMSELCDELESKTKESLWDGQKLMQVILKEAFYSDK